MLASTDNPEFSPDQLPEPEPRQWHSLRPVQAWLECLGNLPFALILTAGIWFASMTTRPDLIGHPALAATVTALLWFRMLIYPHIALRHRGYAVRERDIVFRSGWLWRRISLVSYSRIQHVEVGQGPMQRQFEVSWIKLFTAGGALGDLTINGLAAEEAARVEQWIGERIDSHARALQQALGNDEDVGIAEPDADAELKTEIQAPEANKP